MTCLTSTRGFSSQPVSDSINNQKTAVFRQLVKSQTEDISDLLNLLKHPRFATMMLSKEARNAPGTYTTDGNQSAKPKVHKEALKEALQAVEEKTPKTSQTSLTSASPNLPPAPGTSVSPV